MWPNQKSECEKVVLLLVGEPDQQACFFVSLVITCLPTGPDVLVSLALG